MKRFLVIAISALMLSGCIAEWKNPNGPMRDGTGTGGGQPMSDNTGHANANSGP